MAIYASAPAEALFWDLVRAAEQHAGAVDEWLEGYLVFLLQRWLKRPAPLHRPVGLQVLEAMERAHARGAWQDAGDACLLLAGLFPEQAERRRVSVDYFVRMGRLCFRQAAGSARSEGEARLFAAVVEGFVRLVDILLAVRAQSAPIRSPLMLMELATRLPSRTARSLLETARRD